MDDPQAACDELYAWTMGRGRERFILQHVVDARAAESATAASKPIAVVFALVGLYLHVERGFTGLEIQRVHMLLGKQKRAWPTIVLPPGRGAMTARDVLAAPAGSERERAIDDWCRSLWEAYRGNRETIVALLRDLTIRRA